MTALTTLAQDRFYVAKEADVSRSQPRYKGGSEQQKDHLRPALHRVSHVDY